MKRGVRCVVFSFLVIFSPLQAHGGAAGADGGTFGHPGYFAPTESLTKVANAITLRTYSLYILTEALPGLGLTKPVSVTVKYNSYQGGYSTNKVVTGTYHEVWGLRLVLDDDEVFGTVRQGDVRVELFEPQDSTQGVGTPLGKSFDLDLFRFNLDPLYDVNVSPIQVTLIEACPQLTGGAIGVRWSSPDNREHDSTIDFLTAKTVLVTGSQWNAQAVSASSNYHIPYVGLYIFGAGNAPTKTNLIPAPLAGGTLMAAQDIKFQLRDTNRHCAVQIGYVIYRKLTRYVDPSSPAPITGQSAGAKPQ